MEISGVINVFNQGYHMLLLGVVTHVYPYDLNDPIGPKYSKEQHHSDAAKTVAEKIQLME